MLAIFVTIGGLWSHGSQAAPQCSDLFESDVQYNIRILSNARKYRLSNYVDSDRKRWIWRWSYQGSDGSGETRKLTIEKSLNPISSWKTRRFTYQGENYRMINVGSNMMKRDLEAGHELMRNIFEGNSKDSYEFEASGEASEVRDVLSRFRWLAHRQVIAAYRESKGSYLSDIDLKRLELHNLFYENSDVFILLKEPQKALRTLTEAEINEHLLMTIQVSYAEGANNPIPHVAHLIRSDERRQVYSPLPFSERILGQVRLRISHLKRWLESSAPAEMTRFSQFQEVPEPIKNLFMRHVFSEAEQKNVDSYVATADPHVSRMFSIFYGFTVRNAILPTGEKDQAEVLSYLIKGSPQYKRAIFRMERRSNEVTSSEVSFESVP